MAASDFLTPRGHSRSISIRVPSCAEGGLYARFSLISRAKIFFGIWLPPIE
jgi:hypothetical protein